VQSYGVSHQGSGAEGADRTCRHVPCSPADENPVSERIGPISNDPYLQFDGDGEGEKRLDLRVIFAGIRRRKTVFLVVLLIGIVPALIYPFTLAPVYEATAKVSIEETPEVMSIGADFMPGNPLRRRGWGALAAVMSVAQSDRVLGRVADLFGPVPQPKPGSTDRLLARLGFETPVKPVPEEMVRQGQISFIRRSIRLLESGGGSILEITATGLDPGQVAWLANAVTEALVEYLAEHRHEASRTALTWLNSRADTLRGDMRAREGAISSIVARPGSIRHEEDPRNREARRTVSNELQQAKLDLLALEQQLAQLSATRRALAGQEAAPEIEALRQRYTSAKEALEESRLRYRESHPEVQRLLAVVADLEAQLGPELTRMPEDRTGALEVRMLALEAERRRLRARVNVLGDALEEMTVAEPQQLEIVVEYERLQRELEMDRQMLEVITKRINETLVSAASAIAPARVLDRAIQPMWPASSRRRRTLVLGVGLVFAFSAGVAFLLELIDQKVYDPEQVASLLGTPLLSSIPRVADGSSAERMSLIERAAPASESVRNLRTAILFSLGRNRLRSLVVGSAIAGEGKTTVSMNLATSFCQTGRSVILVDADLRRPRVNKVLAMSREPGLTDILRDGLDPERAIRRQLGFGFDVITSGETPKNSVDLIGSQRMEELLSSLMERYDLVLIDAPILLAVADTLLLAAKADALLIVSKPGSADRAAYRRIDLDLKQAGANLIGVVSNQVDPSNSYEYPSYLSSPYVENDRGLKRLWQRRKASGRG
jgi:succinoglycan biosynthesis transport protein ExoP